LTFGDGWLRGPGRVDETDWSLSMNDVLKVQELPLAEVQRRLHQRIDEAAKDNLVTCREVMR
jgi:hypothetical protein